METSLDAILGGSQSSVDSTATPAQQDATTGQTEGQTNTGGAEKPEAQAGTPPADKPKAEKSEADKAFATLRRELKSERQRREALEREFAQLKAPQQALDPIADPEGFTQSFDLKLSQAVNSTRIAVMDEIAAEKYPDYEELRDLFVEQAQENPALRAEMLQARNPAEFAYKWAKEYKARSEIGDPQAYAEKIRQEAFKEAEAKLEKKLEAMLQERLSKILPSSLAETQTQGGRVTNPTGYNGPTPLSEILKKR